ncbi:MAG: hypothetical protein KKE91_04050, partial [Candidatus Omnitrophica bacterium]|nr:hypothetical protein [Candidatus Omnitrophota bacterium]
MRRIGDAPPWDTLSRSARLDGGEKTEPFLVALDRGLDLSVPGATNRFDGGVVIKQKIEPPSVFSSDAGIAEKLGPKISFKNIRTGKPFELRRVLETKKGAALYHLWIDGKELKDSEFRFFEDADYVVIKVFRIGWYSFRETFQGIGITILRFLADYAKERKKDIKILDVSNYALLKLCYEYISPKAQYKVHNQVNTFDKINWLKDFGPVEIRISYPFSVKLRFKLIDGKDELEYTPSKSFISEDRKKEDLFANSIEVTNKNGKIIVGWRESSKSREPIYYQIYLP